MNTSVLLWTGPFHMLNIFAVLSYQLSIVSFYMHKHSRLSLLITSYQTTY